MTTETTLAEVARNLPGKWVGVLHDDQLNRLSDKLRLSFSVDSYDHRGQIHIYYDGSGVAYPEWYVTVYDPVTHDKVSYPSINVSMTKTGEQIAKDIVRRLLPDAEKVHGLVVKKLQEEKDFAIGKESAIKVMGHACGTEPDRHYQTHELTGKVKPYGPNQDFKKCGYGEFTVNGPDSVNLQLSSMSLKVAQKIAFVLRDIIKENSK